MAHLLRVFLCHSSNDKPTVRELYQKLRAETWIEPWLDEEELYPGQDWNTEIEKAVEAADAIIVCLSKGSITKEGYVQRELRTVLDFADYKPEGTLYIIPVRLEECEPPRRLRAWQYADYFEGQRERAFQRLLVSLKKRADGLGLMAEELKEEPKKEIPAKPFTKLLNPSSLYSKGESNSKDIGQGVKKSILNKKVRWLGIGVIILLVIIFGRFGLNYPINNPPVSTTTASPTITATPKSPTSTSLHFTHTLTPTNTPFPTDTVTPTPILGIGSTKVSEKDDMILLYVPAGKFTMGSNNGQADEKPVQIVDLDAFWIDQTEVTNKMYAKCVDAGQCVLPKNISRFSNPSYTTHPVVNMDWNQARTYCSWVERRLPNEAEWEKAARGVEGRTFPWGSGIDCSKANYQFKCFSDTTPVKNLPNGISPYGAYDMAGNAWEWVSSLFQPYPYNAYDGRENLNATGSRVLRGGSFYTYGYGVRSTFREVFNSRIPDNSLGFRCASSP